MHPAEPRGVAADAGLHPCGELCRRGARQLARPAARLPRRAELHAGGLLPPPARAAFALHVRLPRRLRNAPGLAGGAHRRGGALPPRDPHLLLAPAGPGRRRAAARGLGRGGAAAGGAPAQVQVLHRQGDADGARRGDARDAQGELARGLGEQRGAAAAHLAARPRLEAAAHQDARVEHLRHTPQLHVRRPVPHPQGLPD
mmetsp:Transcript_19779/g.58367  ORF Transcript_19779/g.58367 Transcript_19779/m.58367 type:complete len:200 (-) Transcript_19779:664-1263(-)